MAIRRSTVASRYRAGARRLGLGRKPPRFLFVARRPITLFSGYCCRPPLAKIRIRAIAMWAIAPRCKTDSGFWPFSGCSDARKCRDPLAIWPGPWLSARSTCPRALPRPLAAAVKQLKGAANAARRNVASPRPLAHQESRGRIPRGQLRADLHPSAPFRDHPVGAIQCGAGDVFVLSATHPLSSPLSDP